MVTLKSSLSIKVTEAIQLGSEMAGSLNNADGKFATNKIYLHVLCS